MVIAVDGPRGPTYRAKPGCVRLARAAGVPIIPMAFGGRGFTHPRSWDRLHMPWPINRFDLRFGEPFHPGDDLAAARDEVDRRLHALCADLGVEG
ncbi:MAG: hypothetical protein QM820_42065 [Minicystis sp.]